MAPSQHVQGRSSMHEERLMDASSRGLAAGEKVLENRETKGYCFEGILLRDW